MPILIGMNLIFMCYIAHFKPLNQSLDNKIDLFNEWIVNCCTIYQMTSTDWINNRSTRVTYGYHIVFLILFLIAVNTSVILYFSCKAIYMISYKSVFKLNHQVKLKLNAKKN